MVPPLPLSQACEGFIHYKKATGLSPHTILDYQVTLKKLHAFFTDDPPLASLSREKLIAFFAWLQDRYVSEPDGAAPRGKIKLAPKTIANIHTNRQRLQSPGRLNAISFHWHPVYSSLNFLAKENTACIESINLGTQ